MFVFVCVCVFVGWLCVYLCVCICECEFVVELCVYVCEFVCVSVREYVYVSVCLYA